MHVHRARVERRPLLDAPGWFGRRTTPIRDAGLIGGVTVPHRLELLANPVAS